MRLSIRPVLSILALSLASAGLAQAAPYTITNLGTLGGKQSYAAALNADGLVVGHSSGPQKAGQSDPNLLEFKARAFLFNGSTISTLGTPGHFGLNDSVANDINDIGVVVGYSPKDIDPAEMVVAQNRPFVFMNGVMTDIGLPPDALRPTEAIAQGINDGNLIVGETKLNISTTETASLAHRAFVYDLVSSQWTILPVFDTDPNRGVRGLAINNAGTVTGSAGKLIDDVGYTRAFRWNTGDTVLTDLGDFGGKSSYPHDINDAGHIVGYSWTSEYDNTTGVVIRQGFISVPGASTMTNLGYLSNVKRSSEAFAINDAAQVVGEAAVDTKLAFGTFIDVNHAFLSQVESGARVMRDLNAMLSCEDQKKWVLHRAVDINNKGQIAGFGTIDGEVRAFLLTPPAGETAGTVQSCPAPEVPGGSGGGGGSLGLGLAALLAGLGLMRRR